MTNESEHITKLERGFEYPYDAPDGWWQDSDHESPPAPEDWAHIAARGILYDLTDRRGIKQELQQVDEDVRKEITETMAMLIRHAERLYR